MKKFNTRTLVTLALLVAMHIIFSRFLSINAWNIKIGFAFLPIFIAAYVYGPAEAAVVGALGDFLGANLFPIGAYFPGFTLSCALTGLVFGFLLHKKQSMPRIILAAFINQMILSLFLTTYWISFLYGASYTALLATRVVQSVILLVVETIVMTAVYKKAGAQLRRLAAA